MCFSTEPAITGKEAALCCQSNGCLLRPLWRESLPRKQIHGECCNIITYLIEVLSYATPLFFALFFRNYYDFVSSCRSLPLILSCFSGHLVFCCGRSSRWDICRTRAAVTKRCWSLLLMEAEWTRPRTALGQCEWTQKCRIFMQRSI